MKRLHTSAVLVVAVTTAVQALITGGTLILPAIAPRAAAVLNVPSAWVGIQVSLAYAASTVISLFSGRFVRRFGAVRMTQLSLAAMAAGMLSLATGSLPMMAMGSLLMGAAYGMPSPAAAHLLARFTPSGRRNLMFSLKQTGVPLGGVLAGFLAPPLASASTWNAPLIAAAVIGLVFAALFFPLRAFWDDDRKPDFPLSGALAESIRILLARGPLRYLAAVGFFLAAVQLCVVAFLVVLLVEEYGFTLITAGAAMAATQVAGVCGRISWGFTADVLRDGLKTIVIITAASAVLAFLLTLIPASAPAWLIVLVLCGLGATAIGWNGVFLAEAARLAPAGRVSEATGALLSTSFLGIFLGPSSFAAAVPLMGGYRTGFVLLAAVSAIASGLALVSRLAGRRDPA